MGQYHYPVNLTKKEFLHPHKLGCGLKLVEQGGSGGVTDAVQMLLAVSNGRGGGDFETHPLIGSWGGDQIAWVGDYAEDDDLPNVKDASRIYGRCLSDEALKLEVPEEDRHEYYRDITDDLIPVLEQAFEMVYYGTGWRKRFELSQIEGLQYTHTMGDTRMAHFSDGTDHPLDTLVVALKAHLGDRRVDSVKFGDLAPRLLEAYAAASK